MKNKTHNFPTAAEALLRIQEWHNMPLLQRRNLASALRLLCRIGGGKAPATVRLDPATCLPAMDGASAIALGLTPKTHQNYRAGLRHVLRRLGILAPAHRREPIGDADWAALVQALPEHFHPHRLRALMEYCAAQAIAPGDVTNATLEAYLGHREETRGGPNIRSDVREAARQWNKMRTLIAGWPDATLVLGPPEGRIRTLPFSAYPAGLQAGIERYLAWLAQSPEDAGEEDEAGHEPASPATVECRRTGIRLLLWGLVETGCPPETLTQLDDLVRFDLARQSLRWHRQRLGKPNPQRPAEIMPTAGTGVLADTLRSLAVHLRLTGEADAKFRRLVAVYRPKPQREITEDLSRLLDRLADPETEARLLPQLLMRKARRLRDGWTSKTGVNHPPKPLEANWMAALAMAIEIELHLPLRILDLTRLRLDQELSATQASDRRPPEVHLSVVANKNGRLVETWLRGEAAKLVVEYLQDFRPLGPHPMTAWVFPNRDREDGPRAEGGFSEAIADTIHEHTGVRVNVHAFRAYAAALILEGNPHAIEDVRVLLGHSAFEVALKHYRRANRQGAAQRLSEAISKRRHRAKADVRVSPTGLALDLARQRRSAA